MKTRNLLFISLLLGVSSWNVQSQEKAQKGTVVGSVLEMGADSSSFPLIQATVKVLNPKDSSLVGGQVSDMDGNFMITGLKWGNYLLEVSYIGLEPVRNKIRLSFDEPVCKAGKIYLSQSSLTLEEIVVIGKAAEMVIKEDTVEFNPNAYTNKQSDVMEDLLKKLPGVEITEDGKITYGGKEIQRILIDGKDFFADDPNIATKNIPIEIIERLQILEEQSDAAKKTGIEDDEKETVINISVKKEKKKGWFGEGRAGYGTQERYHARGIVNRFSGDDKYTLVGATNNVNNSAFQDRSGLLRGGGRGGIVTSHGVGTNIIKEFNEKLKLQGNLSFNRSKSESEQKNRRENFLQDSSYFSNSENNRLSNVTNMGFRYKIEYEPDTFNTFVFRPSFSFNQSTVDTRKMTETLSGGMDTVNNGMAQNLDWRKRLSGGLRSEYIHRFRKPGRSMGGRVNIDLEKGYDNGRNLSEYHFEYPDKPDSLSLLDQRIDGGSNRQNLQVSVFYNEPLFNKKNYLQFRYSFRLLKNNSFKETFIPDGEGEYSVLDSVYSKGNRNVFMNHAFNLTYRVIRDKYRYSVGIQGELASTQSESYIREHVLSELPRHSVFNMSPNIDFRYRFSKYKELRIRYTGDMDQPSAQQLLPVQDVSDPLHVRVGNPDLLPSFEHSVSIRYNASAVGKQTTLSARLEYNRTKNSIVSISHIDPETAVKTSSYANVDGIWDASGRLTFSLPLKNKRFQLNSYSYLRYFHNVGFTNALQNTSRTFSANESLSLRFRIDNLVEVGARANGRYVKNMNSIQVKNDKQTFDYTGSLFTTVFLPFDFTVSSDLNYTGNTGYSSGFEKNEFVWNAEIEKTFLKGDNANISLRLFDILQEKTSIFRNITADYMEDGEFEAITSYAMLTFSYKFNMFGEK